MPEIHLSEQDEKFIEEQVAAGVYSDADAVIHASLQLLSSDEGRLTELRKMIREADEEFERGDYVTFTADDDLTAYIIERARNEK
ncbi:MAG: type II toxin-antitoxin system ParD family antitoxin [Agrobacterium sp.]|uniref:Type II toxin-antitoxin system ParD family antitoxin n=1 Tax=Agrobacterium tumefaciens TaxID=358 RepID=A0AAE6BKW0_AGRTU|nr:MULTISPECIES: type II toxin-antitoxin system ParD family antitoxin [Agrobacterium]KNY32012.1 addiction module antitoxin [Agrobacterium sp. SUL3]MCA2373886.1 type II toxin-antitoxin system ParD family antitoxin [Agrobacterium tomkonis CIP 111-78]MCD4663178.1 type II toxin-antitoxin system ParD family antitoxin [Agrobacterium sp.]QCL99366.1 type II toxin-antitoxin system ParD family antitoxin [Agrobacterium tumefaciens]